MTDRKVPCKGCKRSYSFNMPECPFCGKKRWLSNFSDGSLARPGKEIGKQDGFGKDNCGNEKGRLHIKCPRCKATFVLDHSERKRRFFNVCPTCEYRFFVNSEAGVQSVKKEPKARRILVIDDDSQIRAVLREILEHSGYGVMVAPDGHVGLKLHRKNPADLVITDIVMPGKDGLSTIMEIKQDSPEVEIVAISGGGSVGPEDYLQMARKLGVNRTLTKPFALNDLLRVLRELLDEHHGEFTSPETERKPPLKETVSFPA